MSTTRSLAKVLSVTAIACAASVPAASAMPPSDASTSSDPAPVTRDLRSPDTRDAAANYSPAVAQEAPVVRDLRSPDTRDVAAGYDPQVVGEPAVAGPSDGFDWVSAAIGGAVIGGLLILLLAFRPTHLGRRGPLHT